MKLSHLDLLATVEARLVRVSKVHLLHSCYFKFAVVHSICSVCACLHSSPILGVFLNWDTDDLLSLLLSNRIHELPVLHFVLLD